LLYELDTEGSASITTIDVADVVVPTVATTTTPEPMASKTEPTIEYSVHSRNPSIKFLGKDGWAKLKIAEKKSNDSKMTIPINTTSTSSPHKTILVHGDIPPTYGRPIFSEEEIEALLMGGASIAPQVVRQFKL
jgi:hypothetical protein